MRRVATIGLALACLIWRHDIANTGRGELMFRRRPVVEPALDHDQGTLALIDGRWSQDIRDGRRVICRDATKSDRKRA